MPTLSTSVAKSFWKMNRQSRVKERSFVPRIINPVRLKRAAFFSAAVQLRESRSILEESAPWLKTEILSSPQSVMSYVSEEACVFLFDDTALTVLDTDRIRAQNKDGVLVLLSFQPFVHCSPPQAASQKYPYAAKADLVFAVGQDEIAPRKILPSVVRAAEDRLNVEKYSKARRFIFHIVDDEPRWFSQFLPLLYTIIGQRADVMVTRTYEESLRFLFGVEDESEIKRSAYLSCGHGDDVVCLIADIFFPKGSELQSRAGIDLIRLVNAYYPRIPVIIASKAEEARELKGLGFILPKGDPGSLEKLKDYILNFAGLGDFVVHDEEGREMFRAKNISGILQLLLNAEKSTPPGRKLRETLENYGQKDKFSTWLYMHSYQDLGDRLRPRRSRGQRLITILKRFFRAEIARIERTPLILDSRQIFSLHDLYSALRTLDPERIQPYSDDDIFSSWLDWRGYPELAEELRPIHGSGPNLCRTLIQIVGKWIEIYQK
jgi:hypothetical protein